MIRTVYSSFSSDELVGMTLMRDTRTELEVELAQRLEHALGFISQTVIEDEDGIEVDYDHRLDLDGTNS